MQKGAHRIVLVDFVHAPLTFLFSNDFTRILHNDLVGFETTIAAHAIASIGGLDNLNADSVLSAGSTTFCEVSEGAVGAVLFTHVTIG